MTNLTHNSFSYICVLQFSTCFEQPSAHHQDSQLYQYDLWYMSLYVGDRVVTTRTLLLEYYRVPRDSDGTKLYVTTHSDSLESLDFTAICFTHPVTEAWGNEGNV